MFEALDHDISANRTRTDSVLVRPGQHELEASVSFTHTVKQLVQELNDCGGYDEASRTCRGPKSSEDRVVDAACHQQLGLDAREGQLYVLELDLRDAKNCSIRCFVQTLTGNGDLKRAPCSVFPIEE